MPDMEFIAAWNTAVAACEGSLDLTDGDDRAIFRSRVQHAFRQATAEAMREYAAHVTDKTSTSRYGIARNIADAYIATATA